MNLEMVTDIVPASWRKPDCENEGQREAEAPKRERKREREALVPVVADVEF